MDFVDIDSNVKMAVAILRESAELEDEQIVRELVNRGIEERAAVRLVTFVPSAYCRVLLRNSGVRFCDTYVTRDPGAWGQPLAADPVWKAALIAAEKDGRGGVSKEDYLRVAGRSAEFNAINRLLQNGAKLKDMVLTPLNVPWKDETMGA